MYIYIQKRISPLEHYLITFLQPYYFINLTEQIRILFYLQNLNLFFIKVFNV
jgi:hypothetical protein